MPHVYIITRGETYIVPLLATVDGYHIENHRLRLSTTSYPVESGGALTDNAVREPTTVRLSGVVSDVIASSNSSVYEGKDAGAWDAIYTLVDNRTLVDIVTPIAWYQRMIITNCETTRDVNTGDGLRFELTLQEVLRAESQLLVEPITPDSPANGRTSTQDIGRQPLIELLPRPEQEVSTESTAPEGVPTSEPGGLFQAGEKMDFLGRRIMEWLRPLEHNRPLPSKVPFGAAPLGPAPSAEFVTPHLTQPFSAAVPSRLPAEGEPVVLPEYTVTAPRLPRATGIADE